MDPPTTDIYTLSLHDALPIFVEAVVAHARPLLGAIDVVAATRIAVVDEPVAIAVGVVVAGSATVLADVGRCEALDVDRKSTRLNSSHSQISYAVFCLKKKTVS